MTSLHGQRGGCHLFMDQSMTELRSVCVCVLPEGAELPDALRVSLKIDHFI